MYARDTLLLSVYEDEKRYNIICGPSTHILYRYTQFNVILLSVAIENCPSVAHTHIYARIGLRNCTYISQRVLVYIYDEKTLLSLATYVFIKNSANGSETAISICNAVNNSTTLPSPTRQAALTNHPFTTHTPRGNAKFVFRIIAITFLGPFRSGTWDRCSFFFGLLLSDAAAAVSPLDPAAAENNGCEQMAYLVYITQFCPPSAYVRLYI